jgi:hypothetical protein
MKRFYYNSNILVISHLVHMTLSEYMRLVKHLVAVQTVGATSALCISAPEYRPTQTMENNAELCALLD